MKIKNILKKYPYIKEIFDSYNIEITNTNLELEDFLKGLNPDFYEENGTNYKEILDTIKTIINEAENIKKEENSLNIETLSIIGGYDKGGKKEPIKRIDIKKGEIIAVVGPTGSGKSQLLSDIEWMANEDTNTKRKILVDKQTINREIRYSTDKKLVAQLSQNMNFVVDLTVYEFIKLHAESRLIENVENVLINVINKANELAGESFDMHSPITSLSGGQSRALMIADTAILSKSPIVLIDEIENAGIDRKKALDLLISNDKIVIMATHDPLLALMAHKRLVIKNGAIQAVIETSELERNILKDLFKMDNTLTEIRKKIRYGKKIEKLILD